MFVIKNSENTEENYKQMCKSIELLVENETDEIASFANISAFINGFIDKINWCGFYLFKEKNLVLGPFQGNPACIRINLGKGVCGMSAEKKEIIRVSDVSQFKGHIACDSDTKSEIVLPILKNGKIYAVLDIDSPIIDRFSDLEEKYLQQVVSIIEKFLEKNS